MVRSAWNAATVRVGLAAGAGVDPFAERIQRAAHGRRIHEHDRDRVVDVPLRSQSLFCRRRANAD